MLSLLKDAIAFPRFEFLLLLIDKEDLTVVLQL